MADPNSTFYYYPPNSNPQPLFTQPYAAPSYESAPPVYGGLQDAYPNPAVGSQTWVPEQAASSYLFPNVTLPVASSNPPQTKNWSNSYSRSNALKRKMKLNQSVRCEICDIFCTSIELYEKHVSGKKHLKTLTKKYAPQTTPSQPTPQPAVNSSTSEDHLSQKSPGVQEISITAVSGYGMDGASSSAVDEGLDAKKQMLMESGVAEEPVLLCSSSNAICTSDVAPADHLAGEQNNLQVATTSTTAGQSNNKIPSVSPGEDLGTKKKKLMQCGVPKGSMRVCTVCNIVCNSEVVFADHIVGKKHIAQVQKSAGVCNLKQSIPPSAKKIPENIDVKRQKMQGNGTPATSVRVCAMCNVVCNSDSVFTSHLSGQKHASMLKKMAPQ